MCISKSHLSSLLFSTFLFISVAGQSQKNSLVFHNKSGEKILIRAGSIIINKKVRYRIKDADIIYTSRHNKLIEGQNAGFLFLVIDGTPNANRLYCFKIVHDTVDSLADAIDSDVKDLDKDGYPEFGGCDLTEAYPSKDSMYYIPSAYYEIRNDKVLFDSSFTKKKDIEINGIYLSNPLDREGNCCKVIPKPKKKNNH
jgi:hypothetical protein